MNRLLVSVIIALCLTPPLFSSMQSIKTAHTQIIFAEEDEAYGAHVATFADEVFRDLSSFLFTLPKKRVPVVLVGERALANGYYRSFPSSITLHLTAPADRFLSSRSQDWLRSVYTHELTHYLHLRSKVGLSKALGIFGPEGPTLITTLFPAWWVEGVATWTETAFVDYGGRGDSPAFAQLWQAPLAEGRMWSLGQGAYRSAFTPSSRVYATGYLMVDHLIEGWGLDSFHAVNKRVAAFPFLGISPAIKAVTGHSAKELFDRALAAQTPAASQTRGLFIHPLEEANRYIVGQSAIGLLGYGNSPTAGGALYRYREEGAEVILALSLSGDLALSIGQESALFSHLWADSQQRSYSDLYHLDLDSLTYRRLTDGARLVSPAISGDGNRAVASEIRGSDYALVSIDLQEGTIDDLLSERGMSFLDAALNDDGSQLLYIGLKEGNSTLFHDDGKTTRVLLGPTATDLRSPFFDQNGEVYVIAELALWHLGDEGGQPIELLTDAMGVHRATIIGEELYWQTHTAYGEAVKRIENSALVGRTVQARPPLPVMSSSSTQTYIARPYLDHLRFNLALPYPFVVGNRVQPALWFHLSSVLGSQTLTGAVGWSIDSAAVFADLSYQLLLLPVSLAFSVQHNQLGLNESMGGVALALPLSLHANPRTTSVLRFEAGLSATWIGATHLFTMGMGGVGYRLSSSHVRPMDFYGPPSISLSAQVQHLRSDSLLGFATQGQIRIPKSSAMLFLGIDVVGSPAFDVGRELPYYSFVPAAIPTHLKGRLKAALRVPLPLFDLPIPFGGLTHMGLALEAQQAFSLQAGELARDPDWALGATLTAETHLGSSSVPFRPFIQVAYLVNGGRWQYTIGLDNQSLLEIIAMRSDHGLSAR